MKSMVPGEHLTGLNMGAFALRRAGGEIKLS
jgi:hypothetical protein